MRELRCSPFRDVIIASFVLALYLFYHLLHLSCLSSPLFLAHLQLSGEELFVWFPVATANTVPQCGKLPIIVVEVEVMHRVAGSAVDDGRVGDVLAIMDEDCPQIDEDEEGDVSKLLEWEDKWKDVIGKGLRKAVQGMKGMRGKGRRHDPSMMWLVQTLVDGRKVETTMDPIYEEVGKKDEEGILQVAVPGKRGIGGIFVQLSIATYFGQEEGSR